jgi:hypothetical protein
MTDSLNPFDPAALRLDQAYADTVGVKKLLTTAQDALGHWPAEADPARMQCKGSAHPSELRA